MRAWGELPLTEEDRHDGGKEPKREVREKNAECKRGLSSEQLLRQKRCVGNSILDNRSLLQDTSVQTRACCLPAQTKA